MAAHALQARSVLCRGAAAREEGERGTRAGGTRTRCRRVRLASVLVHSPGAAKRCVASGTRYPARLCSVSATRHAPRRGAALPPLRCSAADTPDAAPPVAAASPPPRGWWSANRETARRLGAELRTYGLAGVLAYGLLNTAYYSCAFVLVWTCVLQVPTGLGTAAAARRFAETFVLVWAGSQVTKVARFGGAVLLAPVANALLARVEARLPPRVRSRGAAFTAAVCACLLAAAALFGAIVLLWS